MTETVKMKPINKHLINAVIEWILESDCTPHLLIDASHPNTLVPLQFVDDGKIVLNVTPSAVRDYLMDDKAISFISRFNGKTENVFIPLPAVLAVISKETGAAIPLPPMEVDPEESPEENKPDKPVGLRLV